MTYLPKNIDVAVFRQREGVRWRGRATCTDPATGAQLSVTTREEGEVLASLAATTAVSLLEMKLDELYSGGDGPAWIGPRPPEGE